MTEGYKIPQEELTNLVDASDTPMYTALPLNKHLLICYPKPSPTIRELATPELKLAGVRINPKTNANKKETLYSQLEIQSLLDSKKYKINIDSIKSPKISRVKSSPTGKRISFCVAEDKRLSLWITEVSTGETRRVPNVKMNASLGKMTYTWLNDDELILKTVLSDSIRGKPPKPPMDDLIIPIVQETKGGKKSQARAYQDLLASPHDERLFTYYMTSQLVHVQITKDEFKLKDVGKPRMFESVIPSPNGEYFVVVSIHRPFSYLVKYGRFPKRIDVMDKEGQIVRRIADLPLAESVPIHRDARRCGPRELRWRQDKPATLCWTECKDEGNPKIKPKDGIRDVVFLLDITKEDAQPTILCKLNYRFYTIYWGNDDICVVVERMWKNRTKRHWIVNPSEGKKEKKLFDFVYEDRYNHPGNPITKSGNQGEKLLRIVDNEWIYMKGAGASELGDRPFLNMVNIYTKEIKQIWRSKKPFYSKVIGLLDNEANSLLLSRESREMPPNAYLYDRISNKSIAITNFQHPAPELRNVKEQLITYTREDGVQLSGLLYLPPNYDPSSGEKIPLLIWAYPREFKSKSYASQVRNSPYKFTTFPNTSPLFFLTVGYAVLDGPSFPIIGEGDQEPNDTYLKQLVASARAAVDKVVDLGITTRDQIAIGGHSYGAFMVANLLSHAPDLFACGIARSGCYNRTLTPFGFQSEQRTMWEAKDVYMNMSPFNYADQVKTPILLLHGENDANAGTYPMQSIRYYQALKGHGCPSRLVVLPYEGHRYKARESILHVLWEQYHWLEKYCKKNTLMD